MKAKPYKKRGLIAVATIACLIFASLSLAACATPQEVAVTGGEEHADTAVGTGDAAGAAGAFLPGDFYDKDSGYFVENTYTTDFLNDGNRGCGSCHEDLWNEIEELTPLPHLMATPAGYGKTLQVVDCLNCHRFPKPRGAPRFGDIIHSSHYANPAFVDEMHGNCWSCHASENGELVLYDEFKYTDSLGGYAGAADKDLREWWLSGRSYEHGNMAGVAMPDSDNLNIDVTLSQPITEEEDAYGVLNFEVPDLNESNYELRVTGVNNERTFTLAELKAMPQTEVTATQICMAAPINGTQISNIPTKGVLLKDVIDACGGVKEGNVSVKMTGYDTWYEPYDVQDLLDQGALIAFEFWGHELTPMQGYPATFVVPGTPSGVYWVKNLASLEFNTESCDGHTPWDVNGLMPDIFTGLINSSWFSPAKDGQEYKVGEAVPIKGYALVNKTKGHRLSQVAFSADYGTTWKYFDVPESFDDNQWTVFEGTWTPDEPGTYVLHMKSIDEAGKEQPKPASVIVKVTE